MNAFEEASQIETLGTPDIKEWFAWKGILDNIRATEGEFEQKYRGDYLLVKNGKRIYIEVKIEAENRNGNLYLENWSNKSRFTLGWMYTTEADSLLYYFYKSKELFSIDLRALKRWAFGHGSAGNIYTYQEKEQCKYTQKNDTWGWCVPIADIREALAPEDESVPEDLRYFRSWVLLNPIRSTTLPSHAASASP